MLRYYKSSSTAVGSLALISSKLDWCPGVAGGHEVGVLPRAGVDGSTRLVQVAVGVSRPRPRTHFTFVVQLPHLVLLGVLVGPENDWSSGAF